ncbi:MAG: GWxTD domain-containing protein [Candidatus Aminicenantes bacterium]|nr:GWxTD domain-containing protein [Candidatus Aminicenantes bacterium]
MKKFTLRNRSRFGGKFNFLKMGILVLSFLALGACGMNLLPSKDTWYMQHYIIMQDFERAAYKELTVEGREEFQILFWKFRRPESKREFLKRIAFAANAFKRENFRQPWNTDRARIYLLNGSPAAVDYRQTDNWAMKVREGGGGVTGIAAERDKEDIQARTAEVWTYQYEKQMIYYAFSFSKPNKWKLSQGDFAGNRFLGEFEQQSRERTYGITDIDQYTKELENLKEIK